MITGELKNRIDALWDIFAAGGLVNPLDVIEQITYLMFIHDLDEMDNRKAKDSEMLGLPYTSIFSEEVAVNGRTIDGQQLKWSVFHDLPAAKMYEIVQEWVFPFIKTLHSDADSAYSKYMDDAIFKLPTPLVLSKVVDCLDGIYAQMAQIQETDIRGDVYEYLLSKISQSGRNGQFRTPRHIIRMMVELMDPTAQEVICDPACGTSGFLVAAAEYLRETRRQEIFYSRENLEHYMDGMFHGFDMDRTMLRIGAMNMMTHGIENPDIQYRDSLSDQNTDREKYTLVLANPPFKGSLDADTVSADLLKLCKTKRPSCSFWPSSCGCSRWAAGVLASCRMGCCLALPKPTRTSAKPWWRITAWRPSSPCPAAFSNPTPGCPQRCWCLPKPATVARIRCGSMT